MSNTEVHLTDEQRIVFMEVIEESLRLSSRTHLFNWLQRGVQYLVGHEVMVFGIKSSENQWFDYEFFTTSRYFGETQFNDVVKSDTGLVKEALNLWEKTAMPIFVSNQVDAVEGNNYCVINVDERKLIQSELKSFVVHGFGDARTRISTVVMFGRLTSPINAHTAHLIELLMPHLHCALIKIAASRVNMVVNNSSLFTKKITKREAEILQWLQMGKTNWEISSILNVSPLTIKNHVQNILRKLEVENRGQAAVKATKLGIIVASK
jgi:transcriptional regulator EpsA